MRTCIIEDELHAQKVLSRLIQLIAPEVEVVGTASSVEKALVLLQKEVPDFILLDIKLGNSSGFDLLKHFPDPTFNIIFVTAYNEFAIEAFKWNAVDYITKPVKSDTLRTAINRVQALKKPIHPLQIEGLIQQAQKRSQPEHIILRYDGIVDRQLLKDIIRLEADGSVTYVYCVEKDFTSDHQRIKRKTLSSNIGFFESVLPKDFFRCHQSHIVNKQYLKRYHKSDNYILLLNDEVIPVSRRAKDGLLEWMAQ